MPFKVWLSYIPLDRSRIENLMEVDFRHSRYIHLHDLGRTCALNLEIYLEEKPSGVKHLLYGLKQTLFNYLNKTNFN